MFSLEYLQEQVNDYKSVCDKLLSIASDSLTASKLRSILFDGKVNNCVFNSGLSNIDLPHIEVERRLSMAYLLLKNPETFDYLIENNITVFHGSNAHSLPSILEYGLKSHKSAEYSGIAVTTGEKSTRYFKKRDFISFTDVLDMSQGYASIGTTSNNDKLSFGVVYGTTSDELYGSTKSIYSEIPEIGVINDLPLEKIKVICVPADKINYVRKIVPNGVQVMPMDDMDNKFYQVSSEGTLTVVWEELEKFSYSITSKKFSLSELKRTVISTNIDIIKAWFTKLEDELLGGERIEREKVK